jgi:hypothetical protein
MSSDERWMGVVRLRGQIRILGGVNADTIICEVLEARVAGSDGGSVASASTQFTSELE